jgi:hypothetical protein
VDSSGNPGAVATHLRTSFFSDGILLIPLAALIAVSPLIVHGPSCGHDFEFHLVSWLEVQRSWSQGVFYPHWAQTPNWSAGEPRFVFYPPVTWMLGALLGYVIPWQWVPVVLTFLFLAAAGWSTRAMALRFMPRPSATLAGVLASATPYALFTAYERTAFAELAAASLIPLLLLFAWRNCDVPADMWRVPQVSPLRPGTNSRAARTLFPAFNRSAAPLALTLATIWLTNAPAGVMASYLLAFAALAAAAIHRQWWPILRAAVAASIGIGLAAFYLVPAAYEQRWIEIRQAVDVGMRITDSWLFAHHASPDLALHDEVLKLASSIVMLTATLALTGMIPAFLQRKLARESGAFWLPLALIIPIIFLLQFSFSAPFWNLLPKLQFLQFPWRWLMVLGVPYAIFLATALPVARRRARVWSTLGCMTLVIVLTGAAAHLCYQICDDEDRVSNQFTVFEAGTGVEGTDEYAAVKSDNSLIATGLPNACQVSDPTQELGESKDGATPVWYEEQGSCDDTFTAQLWQNEHKKLEIDADHDGFVVLRLSRYPAWQITINGKPSASLNTREDGLMVLPVAAGPSTIEVRWSTTSDVLLGRRISLISLLSLAGLWIVERRLTTIRLSS